MRLKELRKQHRYTQAQLAEYLNIPLRTYQNYEREVNEPGITFLCELADFYGVSLDYLAGFTEIPNPHNADTMKLSHKDLFLLDLLQHMSDESKNLLIKNAQMFINAETKGWD